MGASAFWWQQMAKPRVTVASPLLFKYTAGDSLSALGATFTNATGNGIRSYIDSNGIVHFANTNVARDSHYISGVRSLLLEGQRTNSCFWACDFTQVAVWLNNGAPTQAAATSCVAGQGARKFTCVNVGSTNVRQNIGTFVNGQPDTSWWIVENVDASVTTFGIRDETAGAFVVLVDFTWATHTTSLNQGAGTFGQINLGNGRWLIWCKGTGAAAGTGAAGNGRTAYLYPVGIPASTFSLIVHAAQLEPAASFPSSLMVTTSAAVTRSADSLSFPFLLSPLAMTPYAKYIDLGTQALGGGATVLALGNTSGADYIYINSRPGGTALRADYKNAGVGVNSSGVTTGIVFGDTVEVRAPLTSAGAIQLGVARNGGAEITDTASAANGIAPAFTPQTLYADNDTVQVVGSAAFQSIKIAAGVQSLAAMRGL